MKVGLQIYSVRRHLAKDPVKTLEEVVKTGYRYLEMANHYADRDQVIGYGLSTGEVNTLFSKLGAKIISAHIYPLDPQDKGHIDRVLSQQEEIGLRYMATNLHDFPNREVTMYYVRFLNDLGEMCAKHGIQLLYHNHFAEFRKIGDETVYEILMKNVDPALMKIQLDTYWVMRAGEDPVELMKKYGSRVRLLHQKDYPAGMPEKLNMLVPFERNLAETKDLLPEDTEAGRKSLPMRELDERVLKVLFAELDPAAFTEIGTGIMDIQKVIDAANTYCQSEYIILEQDFTKLDEFESIRISMDHFKKYRGIEWDSPR